jgi:hypothetical protein
MFLLMFYALRSISIIITNVETIIRMIVEDAHLVNHIFLFIRKCLLLFILHLVSQELCHSACGQIWGATLCNKLVINLFDTREFINVTSRILQHINFLFGINLSSSSHTYFINFFMQCKENICAN